MSGLSRQETAADMPKTLDASFFSVMWPDIAEVIADHCVSGGVSCSDMRCREARESLAIALEQIGVGQNIVVAAFTIIFGGVVLALALALGLGGRELGKEWLEKKFGKKVRGKEKEEKDMWSHI